MDLRYSLTKTLPSWGSNPTKPDTARGYLSFGDARHAACSARNFIMNLKKVAERSAYTAIAGLAKMALAGSADPVSISATAILGLSAIVLTVLDRKEGTLP